MKTCILFVFAVYASSVLYALPSQRVPRRRPVRNETGTVSLNGGGTVTINNYINCDQDGLRDLMAVGGKGGDGKLQSSQDCPLTSYLFPRGGQTTDYIRVKTPVPDMYAGSVCAWVSTGPKGIVQGTLLSYATSTQYNSLILYGYVKDNATLLDAFINNDGYFTDLILPKNRQIHLCFTFSVPGSYAKLFVDGALVNTIKPFKNKEPVKGNGVLILGQEQDGLASGFMGGQAYQGTISNFMMWQRELEPKEIRDMAEPGCQCPGDYFLSLAPEYVMLMGGVSARTILKCPGSK